MARNKVSFLFPILSLLLFLVLSFLRCADSDVARNPMIPVSDTTEEITVGAPGMPMTLQDEDLLKTRPEEFLTSKDVSIVPSRLDRMGLGELYTKIPNPKEYLFDLGPEGQKFKRPCRIEVVLSKADLTEAEYRKIRVFYLDGDMPERIPSMVNKKSGKLVFWVKHFSRYALSRE